MTFICNDQLTRVRSPRCGQDWECPKTYCVGDQGWKNSLPYTVRAFGAFTQQSPGLPPLSKENPRWVWMLVKFKGYREWVPLLIGDTNSFREKLVFGAHRNRAFN